MAQFIALLKANVAATSVAFGLFVLAMLVAILIGLPPPFMIALYVVFGVLAWRIYRWRMRSHDPRPTTAPGGILATSTAAAFVTVALAAQAVPYGRSHSNPAITGEPQWANAETRALMVRACFDCHSNEVEWPWYSNVAPLSWAVTKHIDDGRNKVNYSEFDQPQRNADESYDEVKKGSMPPPYYTFGGVHSDAKLTDAEMTTLLEGLLATPGLSE